MKFGKEFVSQMVPEWQEAYMNYTYLKSLLKDILRFKQRNETVTSNSAVLKRKGSLYRAFSGLTHRCTNLKISPKKEDEDQVILVNAVQEQEGSEGRYQTMFLMSNDEGGEYELMFFRRLDDEFNKVIKFYKDKVEEMLMEAGEINKQMDALIALRIKVDKPIVGFEEASLINLSPAIVSSPASVSSSSTKSKSPGKTQMDVIQEVEMSSEGIVEDEETDVNKGEASSNQRNVGGKMNINGSRPYPLEVLKYVKINIKHETPWSTLKGILMDSNLKNLTFTKEELREVEEQLKIVIIEFYQKLRLLKSYSFLNLLAFSKIMKKYDKITSRSASKAYLKMVDSSYIGNSEELNRLMERVEATFIKHFSNANRRKGINALRPIARREKHGITFLLGLLSGCSIALVVAIGVLIQAKNIFKSEGRGRYMENIFPLYSLFGFIVLHMLMYSANIYFWRRYRVNYAFIFGFKQGSELGYREVFLLSAGLAVATLAGVLSNLDMDMDPHTKSFQALTELVPLGLLTVVLIILLCPFNIIYRSSRFFFIQCVFHCICAPLYKDTLPDFFLADQLTSQVQAFRSLEFYICYYGWGDFKKRTNNCHKSDIFNTFYFIVAVIPYWFRFLQCLRRLFEEKDIAHGINGLRYFSTIAAVVMRTGYELKRVKTWKFMAIISSIIAALASTYWDIVIDWGLLQRHSKNQWLRDKLLVPHKSIYFAAMVLNVLLRFAWLQTVLGLRELFFFHRTALTALVACLEILRRGIWNFFRLENEHLNNVGKYRAFKSVPLPFNYNENDDKDE